MKIQRNGDTLIVEDLDKPPNFVGLPIIIDSGSSFTKDNLKSIINFRHEDGSNILSIFPNMKPTSSFYFLKNLLSILKIWEEKYWISTIRTALV